MFLMENYFSNPKILLTAINLNLFFVWQILLCTKQVFFLSKVFRLGKLRMAFANYEVTGRHINKITY